MKKFDEPIALTIHGYTSKGDGKAKLDAKYRCEVIGALEGEVASVKIIQRKGRVFIAKILEILSCSKDRVKPLCLHANLCGGCRFQHLSYEAQLKLKEDALKQIFGMSLPPLLSCRSPFYMRNKMEFSFQDSKIGLIMAGSKGRVLDLEECHICKNSFMDIVKEVKKWWQEHPLQAFDARKGEGILRSLMIRSSLNGQLQVMLTVMQDLSLNEKESLKKYLDDPRISLFIQIHHAKKGVRTYFELFLLQGEPRLKETFQLQYKGVCHSFDLAVGPLSFLQPNPIQAEKIYQTVLDFVAPKADEVVLDLYAGVGAFGKALAPFVKKVMSVEIVKNSLEDAYASYLPPNMEFFCEDVLVWLKNLKEEVDVVILDPPRAGLEPSLIELLLALSTKKIVYVSCNVLTQKRDLELLGASYEVIAMQPIDQFPHTMHLENIALLKKKNLVV